MTTTPPSSIRVEQTFDLSAHACAEASLMAYLDQIGRALDPPLPGARLWSDLVRAYDARRGRARVPLPHPMRVRLCSLPAFNNDDPSVFWLRSVDPAHRQDSNGPLRYREGGPLELRISEPLYWKPGPDFCAWLERTPGIACAVTIAFIIVIHPPQPPTQTKKRTTTAINKLTSLLLQDF